MKVVIVEDMSAYWRVMERLLTKAGHEVAVVSDFSDQERCLEAIRAFEPDVVVLDHYFEYAFFTGETIAKELGGAYPIVGVSSDRQRYVTRWFPDKKKLIADKEAQLRFLALFGS